MKIKFPTIGSCSSSRLLLLTAVSSGAALLNLSTFADTTLLETDFIGRTLSGNTANNVIWTVNGIQDPGSSLTVVNETPGVLTGLNTNSAADDHFAVAKNLVGEGPWSVSIPLVLTVGEVTMNQVAIDWQHFSNTGSKQTNSRVSNISVSVTGSASGLLATVQDDTADTGTDVEALVFSPNLVLTNAETYQLKITVSNGTSETLGHNLGFDSITVTAAEAPKDPGELDSDRDGLTDYEETNTHGTDPNDADSDDDGTPDGIEIDRGLNPNDPNSYLERPNIIYFLVDDMGYGDLGCFWQDQRSTSKKFDTPVLDQLAADGAKVTHHYVGAAVCMPSRTSFMQGRHQGHADLRNNSFDQPLPDTHNVAELLRRAGYHNIHLGKAGMAGGENSVDTTGTGSQNLEAHPLARGFDEFFGYLFHADGHEHYPQNGTTGKTAHIFHDYQRITTASLDLYTTDAWTAYAKKAIVEEVQDGDNQPFFIYFAYDTPHSKMQRPAVAYPAGGGLTGGIQWTLATDASGNTRYASTADGTGAEDGYTHPDIDPTWTADEQRHVGMIRRIDNSVADVLQLLDDLGIADNTLVVFTSDNGPHHSRGGDPRFFESYAGFEGIKRDMLEGGIRVPTIVRWGDKIAGATGDQNNIQEIDYPSGNWDWMPTFAELAGVPAPSWCDGVSLLPTLTGGGVQRDKGYLYFEYYEGGSTPNYTEFTNHAGERRRQMQAVRIGDYMGVRRDIASAADDFQIYDVTTDLRQANDLAGSMADLQSKMKNIVLQTRRAAAGFSRPYDSASVPNATRSLVAGVNYAAYEGIWSYVPEYRDLNSVRDGVTTAPDATLVSGQDDVGILFTGYIDVPVAGDYTFYLESDTGAQLFLHDAHVVDDDFHHDGSEVFGTITLDAGLHPFRLYYRHDTRPTRTLNLSWSSATIAKELIPDARFFRIPEILPSMGTNAGSDLVLKWNSLSGQSYVIRASETLEGVPSDWPIHSSEIAATAPENTANLGQPGSSQKFFVVSEE